MDQAIQRWYYIAMFKKSTFDTLYATVPPTLVPTLNGLEKYLVTLGSFLLILLNHKFCCRWSPLISSVRAFVSQPLWLNALTEHMPGQYASQATLLLISPIAKLSSHNSIHSEIHKLYLIKYVNLWCLQILCISNDYDHSWWHLQTLKLNCPLV